MKKDRYDYEDKEELKNKNLELKIVSELLKKDTENFSDKNSIQRRLLEDGVLFTIMSFQFIIPTILYHYAFLLMFFTTLASGYMVLNLYEKNDYTRSYVVNVYIINGMIFGACFCVLILFMLFTIHPNQLLMFILTRGESLFMPFILTLSSGLLSLYSLRRATFPDFDDMGYPPGTEPTLYS